MCEWGGEQGRGRASEGRLREGAHDGERAVGFWGGGGFVGRRLGLLRG